MHSGKGTEHTKNKYATQGKSISRWLMLLKDVEFYIENYKKYI